MMNAISPLKPIIPLIPVPPIPVLALVLRSGGARVDAGEHFVPQTVRNRYYILGPNGTMALTIPVASRGGLKVPSALVRIDCKKPWVRQHIRSLEAAYRSAPYYEHYMHHIEKLFSGITSQTTLLQLYTDAWCLWESLLKSKLETLVVHAYIEDSGGAPDYRLRIKGPDFFAEKHASIAYPQVFAYKGDFVPYLSVIDLLMNTGPCAMQLLTA